MSDQFMGFNGFKELTEKFVAEEQEKERKRMEDEKKLEERDWDDEVYKTKLDLLRKVRRNKEFMALYNEFKEVLTNYLLYGQAEAMEEGYLPATGYGGGDSFFTNGTSRFVEAASGYVAVNQGIDGLIDPFVSMKEIEQEFERILKAGKGSRKGFIIKECGDYIIYILNEDFIQDYIE